MYSKLRNFQFKILKRLHDFLVNIYLQNYDSRVFIYQLSVLPILEFVLFYLVNSIRPKVERKSQTFPSKSLQIDVDCLHATLVVSYRLEEFKPRDVILGRISILFNTDAKLLFKTDPDEVACFDFPTEILLSCPFRVNIIRSIQSCWFVIKLA